MAYAAVLSLKNTFERLVKSCRISLDPSPSLKILGSAYKELVLLQETLIKLNKSRKKSERMKALEGQMRDEVCKLEDSIESYVVSSSERLGDEGCPKVLTLDVQDLKQDIDCFRETAKKWAKELRTPLPEEEEGEDDGDDGDVSRMDFGGKKSEMVGLSDQFGKIKDQLLDGAYYIKAFAIVGMAGIGKTALAKKLFEDPLIMRNFECRAFVRMGMKNKFNVMLHDILEQVDPDSDETMLLEDHERLWKKLNGRRYLIVLDDVWSTDFWDDISQILPQQNNGSRVLVMTRLDHVALSISMGNTLQLRFLSAEESWDLLREKVFVEPYSSLSQLEKAGKKTAENCEGLPLLILAVADLLYREEKTLEHWNELAEDKENPIYTNAYDQISKVLYPSFHYLSQQLKLCFLYIAVFPRNYLVGRRRLVTLWNAEGFLEPKPSQTIEEFGVECFEKLVSCNVVVVRQKSLYRGRVKSCSLHFVFWILCRNEARNEKLLHVLNRYADGFAEEIEGQRRLSIYNNTLFAIEDVHNSIAMVSKARSLLCTCPYHQYQVPLCLNLRLLRLLDALSIRLYEFPLEVLKLLQTISLHPYPNFGSFNI